MAAIRLEDEARKDPRFVILGKRLGTTKFDARARMEELWAYCTEKQIYHLNAEIIDALAEFDGFHEFICDPAVDLAERSEQGDSLRIKGTLGRIEWLAKLRENGKLGGRPPKEQPPLESSSAPSPDASPSNNQTETKGKPDGNQEVTKSEPEANPLTPVLVPVPVPINFKNKESIGANQIAPTTGLPEVSKKASVKKAAKAQAQKAANLKAQEFNSAYVKAYQTKWPGKRPEDLNDGRTVGQILNWVKSYPSLDRACQLIQVYFQMDRKWFNTKGYDFITFRNHLNLIGQALDSGSDPDGNQIDWERIRTRVGA